MPRCENCGGYLTESYVRVFALPELEASGACRYCGREGRAVDAGSVARLPRADRS